MSKEPIEPGTWRAPLWLGCEPRITLLLVAPLILAILSRSIPFIVFTIIVVIALWAGAVRLADKDEQHLQISIDTRSFWFLRELDRLGDIEQRPLRLPNVERL